MQSRIRREHPRAYPLVPSGTKDYEEWARAWCEQRGWKLITIVTQRRCSKTHHQLTLEVER